MQVFDASSMIYAWDNYPVRQFPGLWQWIASQIEAQTLVMPGVAYDEVAHKTPDCGAWLRNISLKRLEINNAILENAMRIKGLLDIAGDAYHPKGVGENDILIIATALVNRGELVANEGRQQLPDIAKKRKIPAVCAMAEVAVPCINFIEYIKRTDQVFG
jgi:predicted nucleic acid-binding protein